jgi:hypothetical protein
MSVTPAEYPVLGQASPGVTSETDLYEVPPGLSALGSTLFLANITHLTTPADIFVTVRVRPAGVTSAAKHIIVPGIKIRPRQVETITAGFGMVGTDLMTVECSVANGLAATLFGAELP